MTTPPSIARRSVLSGASLGFLASLFVPPAKAKRLEIFCQRSYANGIPNEERERIESRLRIGDRLKLRPVEIGEMWAVMEVFTEDGTYIGNLQPLHAEPFARLIEAGQEVVARVAPHGRRRFADICLDLFLVA